MRALSVSFTAAIVVFLVACGGEQRPPLETGSVAHHDQEAAKEEAAAKEHVASYDPNAQKVVEHCGGGPATKNEADPPCWTEVVNPTEHNLAEADEHRKHAAEHRAASLALRKAEEASCKGVSPLDRDVSPFHHSEEISKVTILDPPTGAAFTFKKVAGLDAPALQRIVECHIARNAALGFVVPEMPYCPLVAKGVKAEVSDAGSGIVVKIWSDDAEGAKTIVARAKAFLPSK